MKGSFSFIVRDENLNFEEISEKLSVLPTSTIKKGQIIRTGGTAQALYDIWRFEIALSEQVEPDEVLESLLQKLTPNFEKVNELVGKYKEVNINCYLRSEYGQMGFELSSEIVRKIALLGVGVDFHILSFGGVES
ncbi:DUF4279 domain-containing protein [Paenibacillus sp. S150]|uniref:DUF4279 domain-containing protein n=1 Tax=Paenibacillus sp. S150 TaxID=2749826 RepID=UPI001C58C68E|nr:DUF4279 domain-containing protein [Paenibacillus sp. S150]MBW4085752.1 DUF4279 domain-containing protein [Paenibacillus sp. S150]